MIELDVDMGYLLEDGEPDCVTLNDENGEFEPMTFYRGDTGAVAFCKRVESAVKERKPLTLFGVDYETAGDVPFCEQVDRWLHGDAPSECRECSDGKYDELTALVDNTCKPMPDGTCPSCGETVENEWVTVTLLDGTMELRPTRFYNYCPGCGRKVVDE